MATVNKGYMERRLTGEEICIFCGKEYCVKDYDGYFFVPAEAKKAVHCTKCNKGWAEIHKVTAILPYHEEE